MNNWEICSIINLIYLNNHIGYLNLPWFNQGIFIFFYCQLFYFFTFLLLTNRTFFIVNYLERTGFFVYLAGFLVQLNSPNLYPIMSFFIKIGIYFIPLCIPILYPTHSGIIITDLAFVLINTFDVFVFLFLEVFFFIVFFVIYEYRLNLWNRSAKKHWFDPKPIFNGFGVEIELISSISRFARVFSFDRGWTYNLFINSKKLYHWATKDLILISF